jgi:large subunit ribosomal protein L25
MNKMEISAESRNAEEASAKDLLKEGLVPGVVYGHGFEAVSIKVGKKEFASVLKGAGESSLINLVVGGKEVGNVVIKDYQEDPITGEIIHFDLHKIKMTEKLVVNVDINFIGESPAVKNEGGIIVTGQDSIEIRCLPADLIHEVDVDMSKLEHVDDIIRVKDLNIPANVEILDEEENVIVSVEPQRTDAEMEDLEEKPEEDVNKVEGAVKEEKPEEADKKTDKKKE